MKDDSFRIFISATTDEFGEVRSKIAGDLRARWLEVKVQDDFTLGSGQTTLAKLHNYVQQCSAIVSIIGLRDGSFPPAESARDYLRLLPEGMTEASYTQWEVILGLHYSKRVSIHVAKTLDDPRSVVDERQRKFINYLESIGLDRLPFSTPEELRIDVLREPWPDNNPLRELEGDTGPEVSADATLPIGILKSNCPYLGPVSFQDTEEHRQLFFGRDQEARDIICHLRVPNVLNKLLPIYAPSGTGKTSLINTIVRHKLEKLGYAVWRNARVGGRPPIPYPENVRNVYTFLIACSRYPIGTAESIYASHATDSLVEIVRKWKQDVSKERSPAGWVIFFDQFEEIFFEKSDDAIDADVRSRHRAEFFSELRTLSESVPEVRVALMLRKEYMYDLRMALRDHMGVLPDYLLQKFGPRAAMEAVVKPAKRRGVNFDQATAKRIVAGLSQTNKKNPDGDVLEDSDEVIEPVHLSVVCFQLWQRLVEMGRAGGTTILPGDLDKICGQGKDERAFVSGALESWYRDIVCEVAGDSRSVQSRYTTDKIYREMLKFITEGEGDHGTRVMVPLGKLQSGPFPNWLIKMLVDRWLLRWAEGGWYELTHDRLIGPVRKAAVLDEEGVYKRLLILTDRIADQINEKGTLAGLFEKNLEINNLALEFVDTPGLSSDELEFIFRSTLAEGNEERIAKWTRLLARELEERLLAIVQDALAQTDEPPRGKPVQPPAIRTAAAKAVGYIPANQGNLVKKLVATLAYGDVESELRQSSAISVARIDDPELYSMWVSAFSKLGPLDRGRMLRVFAHALNERSFAEDTTNFSKYCLCKLNVLQRLGVYRRLLGIRFVAGINKFLYVVPLCAISAALFTSLVRWVPAMWNYTWTQELPPSQWIDGNPGGLRDFNPMAALEGTFQAVCGGLGYAAAMSLAMAIAWIVLIRGSPGKTRSRRVGTLLAGLIGGFIGGIMLNLLILPVFKGNSLLDNGWVRAEDAHHSDQIKGDLLGRLYQTLPTHCPSIYPIYGVFLGIGCAWTILSFRSDGDKEWNEIVDAGNIKGLRMLFWRTLARSWRIAICMASGAAILCLVINCSDNVKEHTVVMKNFCDAGSIVVGGIGYSIALLYGFMLIRNGFRVVSQGD